MNASMHAGVQTWPVATGVVVASEALPADGAAKAFPLPNPPPQAGEGAPPAPRISDAADAAASALATRSRHPRESGDPASLANDGAATAAQDAAAKAGAALTARPATQEATTAAAPPAFATTSPADAGALGGTFVALLLVVGLILLLAWLAKRMPGVAGTSNPALRIVGSLPLGPRERVVVVDVGGTQLLLATGAGGTRALHTLEQPLPVAAPAASPFAQLLARQVRQSVGPQAKGTKPA